MDEIQGCIRLIEQVAFDIVNLEFAVRRDPFGLNGAGIGGGGKGTWIVVSKVQRPDTCADANIEDFLRFINP